MAIMGEGSSNQGDVHEGLNFAAIHRLPFIFVVENNGYAISVPGVSSSWPSQTWPIGRPDTGSRGSWSMGPMCSRCYTASREAVARARAGDGPTLIEAKVTRLTGHSSDDQETKYRSGRGARRGARPRRAATVPRATARRAACSPMRSRSVWRPRSRPRSRMRLTTRRPSRTRPGDGDALRLRRSRGGRGSGAERPEVVEAPV